MINIIKDKHIKLELALLVMVLISIVIGFFVVTAWHHKPIINEQLHSALEVFLGLAGLLAAYLLLSRENIEANHIYWPLAAGYLFKGILVISLAPVKTSNLVTFLHSAAHFGGGLCFALVLLPDRAKITKIIRKKLIPITVMVSALILVWGFYFEDTLPLMLRNTTFTPIAFGLNFLGGIFYLVAAYKLLLRYHRLQKTDLYLLGGVALFLGLGGIMFSTSELWNAEWWYWHFLRFGAHCFGLTFLFIEHTSLVSGLKSSLAENKINQQNLNIRNWIAAIFLTVPDEQMYSAVLDVVLKAFGSKYGIFGYIDENGNLVLASMTKDIWEKCRMETKDIVFPRSMWGGIWGRALIEKKNLYSNAPFNAPQGHIPVTRAMSVPILYQGNLIGMFTLANKETDYTKDDVKFLEDLAGYTAPILNARLQRDRQEQARRLAEQQLREERDMTRNYLDIAGVMIVVINADQTAVLVNKKCCEVLGYSESEILSNKWFDTFVPQKLRDQVKIAFAKLIAGEIEPVEFYENPLLRKDGQERLIAWHTTIIRDEKGKIIGTLSSGEDITEYKQTEAELENYRKHLEELVNERTVELRKTNDELGKEIAERKELEVNLRFQSEIAEQTSVGISLVRGSDQVIIYTNPKLDQMFGYEDNELLGKQMPILNAPTDKKPEGKANEIISHLNNHDFWQGEIENIKKDGTHFWCYASVSKYEHPKHGVVFISSHEDITERKQAEERLQQNEAILANAQRIAHLGSWQWDITTNVLSWSDETYRMLGFNPQEFVPQYDDFVKNVHPEDRESVLEAVDAALKGKAKYNIGHRLLLENGAVKYVQSQGEVERNENGFPICMVGTMLDISERKRAEEALQKAHAELEKRVEERTAELKATHEKLLHSEKLNALGKLVATIAHEFKNPLWGIKMVLQAIGDGSNLDEKLRKQNNLAVDEIDRLFRMLENLKDFYRPSEGIFTPLDINQLIESVLQLSQKKLLVSGIRIVKQFSKDIPQVPVIADQIKQVFLNLISNADDAMQQSGGCLTIETKAEDDKVKVVFRDEGGGISQENMEKLFKPFFTTKPMKGTGLGLAVSNEIVKKHGGEIFVENTPGKGSVFTVELPCTTQSKNLPKF